MKFKYRWVVALILFIFLLFHQADKMVISPLVSPIMEEFQVNEAQMGAISSLAIIVASLLYPLWGYFSDRFARSKLLALSSLIWGGTTTLSALAPNFRSFMAARASTGIDDSSYPGLYSLLSDYFGPEMRGKVYGYMQMSGPLGFMLGTVLATTLGTAIGWRNVFIITGVVGIGVAALILFVVKDRPRGKSEPELRDLEDIPEYRIDWESVRGLLKNRSLVLLMAQGFFGVFPWNVLTFWFFRYLETERGYTPQEAMLTMIVAIGALTAGYIVGGNVGDTLFQCFPRGRVVFAGVGVLAGGVFLSITLLLPMERQTLFLVLMGITGIAMSLAPPNVMATVHDVTLPEVRSTAQSLRKLLEDGGAAVSPFLAGLIAMSFSLHTAILSICLGAWLISAVFFGILAIFVPQDITRLRETMRKRAEKEK
jgi:MFS family permease